jgi:hypothetical protein
MEASLMRHIETLIQDIRYGWRTMLRTPGVSAVAVLSLALGIGANAGIYALIDRVILRVLPVKDPRQLVVFDDVLPHPEFKDLRDQFPVFDGAAGSASLSAVTVGDSDDPSNVLNGVLVSGNYFDVLGVHPLLGHALTAADDTNPGAHPVIVISYAAWKAVSMAIPLSWVKPSGWAPDGSPAAGAVAASKRTGP